MDHPPCELPCPMCGSSDIRGLFLAAHTPTEVPCAPAGSPLLESVKSNVLKTVLSARVDCLLHRCLWCGYGWVTECSSEVHPYAKVLKDLYRWLYWDDENGCYDEEREWESASDFIEYAADLLRRINFRPEDPDV